MSLILSRTHEILNLMKNNRFSLPEFYGIGNFLLLTNMPHHAIYPPRFVIESRVMIEDSSSGSTEGRMQALCVHCRHYYVTWDRVFPHGCRAMGFKSRMPPALQVKEASGMGCQMFARKDQSRE
jgi:hypothetical protein